MDLFQAGLVGVEGAHRLLIHAARIEDGLGTDSIPLHRWVLSSLAPPKFYRQMRLANVRSYDEMVARQQELEGYRIWLKQSLGGSLDQAADEQLLPITMAPRGYTVQEALELPAKWKAEAAERQEREAERKRNEEERRRKEQEKQDRIQALLDESEVEETRHQITAKTGTAAAQAAAATAQAEAEAEAARIQAEHTRREAEVERIRNERIAKRDQAARQERDAIEIERQNQAARLEVAELEARAQRAEDYARLSPRERNERCVARMLQHADGDVEAVPLKDIQEALSIGRTAASELRTAAVELLKAGH